MIDLSSPPSQDPGFEVPGGDPDQLQAAAQVHSDVANMLEEHAAVIYGQAKNLAGMWQGEAAGSYQQLSEYVRAHFSAAAVSARDASSALVHWSGTLRNYKHAAETQLKETQHWLKQQQHWFFQLRDAERDVKQARQQLQTVSAANPLTGKSPAADPAGPFSSPFSNIAGGEVAAARQALTAAEQRYKTAKDKFDNATNEVVQHQARGRQIWQDAMDLAHAATGTLNAINVTPPPLAGYVTAEPHLTQPKPWYDKVLNVAGDIDGVATAVTGAIASVTVGIPYVDVATGVAAGVTAGIGVGIDWAKVLAHDDEPVGDALLDTGTAVLGGGALGGGMKAESRLAEAEKALKAAAPGSEEAKGLEKLVHELEPRAAGWKGANAIVGTPAATVSGGVTAKSIKDPAPAAPVKVKQPARKRVVAQVAGA